MIARWLCRCGEIVRAAGEPTATPLVLGRRLDVGCPACGAWTCFYLTDARRPVKRPRRPRTLPLFPGVR